MINSTNIKLDLEL